MRSTNKFIVSKPFEDETFSSSLMQEAIKRALSGTKSRQSAAKFIQKIERNNSMISSPGKQSPQKVQVIDFANNYL